MQKPIWWNLVEGFLTECEYFFCMSVRRSSSTTLQYPEDFKVFDKQGVGESLKQHLSPKYMASIVYPARFSLMSSMTCQNYTAGGHLSRRRWLQLGGCKQVLLPAGVNRCMMACRWMVVVLFFFNSAFLHFRWIHCPVSYALNSHSAWNHVDRNSKFTENMKWRLRIRVRSW